VKIDNDFNNTLLGSNIRRTALLLLCKLSAGLLSSHLLGIVYEGNKV